MSEIQQLRLWVKVIYALGAVPNTIKSILFGIFTLYFYTTVMGLPGTLVGIASAIGLVWDAIIDPVLGAFSDNIQGQFGKRHGLMLIGAAGMGISFWLYFSPPVRLSTEALFSWLLVTNILVRTMTSVFVIPYYALGAELSQDYHERTSIVGVRSIFGFLGSLFSATVSFILFFPSMTQGVDPKLNMGSYRMMGLCAGALMTITAFISTLGTLPCRQSRSSGETKPEQGSISHLLLTTRLALQNQSFRCIFISSSLFFLGAVINAAFAIHFFTYYVKITDSKALSAFQLSFYLGALVSVFFWLRISRTIEKRWICFAGTLCVSIIMGCAFLLLGEGHLFGAGNLKPLLLGQILAGFFASTLWIMPASMIADVADQDELLNCQRREGVFFGLFSFGEQIGAGVAILIAGIMLDWFAGVIPGQVQQSAVTITRIGMLYSLLPSALLVLAALLILPYTLDQKKVAAIQLQLNENRRRIN